MRYWLVGLILIATPVIAQEIHRHPGVTDDPAVDRFYSTWKQPNNGDERYVGCCNRIDCYPVQAQYRAGHWWFLHRESKRWLMVPDKLVEHDQPDPRESPDGQNHVCASPHGHVYCFAAGSQI